MVKYGTMPTVTGLDKMSESKRNPLGSIFERKIKKHGKAIKVWDVRKRYRDESGIYKDKTKRCYSYAEALVVLGNLPLDIKSEQAEISANSAKTHRLSELIDYFRLEYVKPAVYTGRVKISGYRQSLKTIENYLDEIATFFGDPQLQNITYEQCRSFRDKLASTPTKHGRLPAASTYHKKIGILSKLFTVGTQLDWMQTNPLTKGPGLIKKKAENVRQRMMTFDEEARLLAQCTDERAHLAAYIIASVDTGMRRSEVYNLRWWQIDFANHVIYLTEDAAMNSKTGAEGILPLTDRLAAIFRTVRGDRIPPKNELVLGRCEFKRSWATACKLAGIVGLQYKDLRRTGTTRMLLSGSQIASVQKVSRHARPEILLDIYNAVDVQNAQEIGRKLHNFNEKQRRKGEAKGKAKQKASGK